MWQSATQTEDEGFTMAAGGLLDAVCPWTCVCERWRWGSQDALSSCARLSAPPLRPIAPNLQDRQRTTLITPFQHVLSVFFLLASQHCPCNSTETKETKCLASQTKPSHTSLRRYHWLFVWKWAMQYMNVIHISWSGCCHTTETWPIVPLVYFPTQGSVCVYSCFIEHLSGYAYQGYFTKCFHCSG